VARLRPVSHEDRLSVVEHLDELRSRLMVAGAAFLVATALCGWQNHLLLELMNAPLDGLKPVTLSPTEPFMTTLTLAAYGGLLLSLPIVLYELYAYVMPAFSTRERRVALPLLLLVPILFIGGVVFCYLVVLPPAMDFLLQFNADEFRTELRARDYYGFAMMTMIALGVLFQVPVGVLLSTRLGITTPAKLRRGRRYAIVGIAVLAALLPTIDPITMLIEMVPLVVLYELSILLASAFGRPSTEVADRVASAESS
jgi:sec-independent protein translocase protein TatC